MKRIILLLAMIFTLILSSTVLAASADLKIYDFEEFSQNDIDSLVSNDEGSRNEFSIDSAQSNTGKALRITLNGAESSMSALSMPLDRRNLTGYSGVYLYVSNVTHTGGIDLGLHFVSRTDAGDEYHLFVTAPEFADGKGKTVKADMDNYAIKLPEDFNGYIILPFTPSVVTDQNGDEKGAFDFSNVVSVLIEIDPLGVDLSGSVLLMDNIYAYKGSPNLPAVTMDATQSPTVSDADSKESSSKNFFTTKNILIISGGAVVVAAVVMVVIVTRKKKGCRNTSLPT